MNAKHALEAARKARLERLEQGLETAIKDAEQFLRWAQVKIEEKNGAAVRAELANASNAIDDAMGAIDRLMAHEPTQDEWEGL